MKKFHFFKKNNYSTNTQAFHYDKKNMIKCIVFWVLLVAIAWYIMTPSIAINGPGLIFWSIAIIVLLKMISIMFSNKNGLYSLNEILFKGYAHTSIISKVLFYLSNLLAAVTVIWIFVSPIVFSPVFNAQSYANRIEIENVDFSTVNEVDFTKTPIIDRESTIVLGDRVMGEMPELVSQFEVSTEYTQISYKDSVYRVTPLEYADFIKYFGNRNEGIPAYILVNSVTGEAELVKLKDLGLDGMKYVPSGHFNENLHRQLQMQYPNLMFGSPSFEIDDEGHPWYVCTTYSYTGYQTRQKVSGVVLFDPITANSIKYDDVLDAPKWVDRIYPESLVIEEVDNNGSLQSGFINSIFGQKNVTVTSDGYNYLEQDGDIYIYSGITSANEDASNLGFVLINLRTHDAMKISSAGANESSAMNSAEGEVRNYGYTSTFPLLVNVNGDPVYMMALKDDNGLIKMYAMVDATDYQKVATIESDEGFETLKKKFVSTSGGSSSAQDLKEKDITIASVQILDVDGTSKCFITDTENKKYKCTLTSKNEDVLAFLKAGDTISITFEELEDVSVINTVK